MPTDPHTAPAIPPIAAIAIMGGLFFIIGFVTWLNGPLIGFVHLAFALDEVGAFLVPMAFYLSYFFLALPAAALLRNTGMKKGMALGLAIMALGAFAFGHYATVRWYPGALSGLFVMGGGLAILQTAVNPYISILGPIETAARRIAIMGICNKVAGILAPLVLGALVMRDMGDLAARVAAAEPAARDQLLAQFAAGIHAPYLMMATVLLLTSAAILFSPLPNIRASEANRDSESVADTGRSRLRQFPHLWLGAACIFAYVGVEVLAGDAIGTYGNALGLPLDATKFFTSLTLGAMLAGYIAGLILIPRVVSQERWLAISALAGMTLSVAAWLSSGYLAVGLIATLGFANAMMWPAIFPLAIRGLGRLTERGSAILIMGIAGGAVMPQLFAVFKQHYHFQSVFLLLALACYLYVFYYAVRGYRVGRRQHSAV